MRKQASISHGMVVFAIIAMTYFMIGQEAEARRRCRARSYCRSYTPCYKVYRTCSYNKCDYHSSSYCKPKCCSEGCEEVGYGLDDAGRSGDVGYSSHNDRDDRLDGFDRNDRSNQSNRPSGFTGGDRNNSRPSGNRSNSQESGGRTFNGLPVVNDPSEITKDPQLKSGPNGLLEVYDSSGKRLLGYSRN